MSLRAFKPRILSKNFLKNLSRNIIDGVYADVIGRINPADAITSSKSPDDYRPGDVEIHNIDIVSGDGKRVWSLMPYVTEFHIFESIVYPTMFCELNIADSIGLYEKFPLTTDEFVTISIKTRGRQKESEYRFAINSIGGKQTQENNKMVTYTLQLVSPEIKASAANHLASKQFNGTISELIESILKEDIGTKKPINIEKSTGIIDKTIGPRFPFAMIHEHYLDADNRRDNNGVYTFFENKHGYNLITFEKLIKEGRKSLDLSDSDKRFVFTPERNANAADVKFRNILAYNQSKFCEVTGFISSGGLNSTALAYDFSRGAGVRAKYKESENGAELPTTDTKGTTLFGTNFVRQFEENSIVNMLIAVNIEVRPNTNIAEVLVKRNAYLQRLQQIEAQIFIYGDTYLSVGDVIECIFPSSTSAEDDKGETRLDSGNYLITHLRHMIINGDRPQHVVACNLMKAGMKGN